MLESKDCNQKILIDGLQSHEDYMPTPANAIDKLCKNKPPFDHIALLLCTHFHRDHFSAEYTAAVLSKRSDLKFISNSYAIELLKAYSKEKGILLNPDSLIPLSSIGHNKAVYTYGNIKIEAVNFQHQGNQYADVPMTAFTIEMNHVTTFFSGDIGIIEGNNHLYQTLPDIDLAILPFYFAATAHNQKIVLNQIHPVHLVCVHTPRLDQDNDLHTLYQASKKYYERTKEKFLPCIFMEDYMQKYIFEL